MTTEIGVKHHTLSVLVENKAGVLTRVASLFARRGFNIYSLAVAPTDDERFSRITIVVDVESKPLEQITKQLFKLINVVKINELAPGDAIERELLRPLGIVAIQRTGRVALPRLDRTAVPAGGSNDDIILDPSQGEGGR